MIVKIDFELFNSENDDELQSLSDLINLFHKKRFLLEISDIKNVEDTRLYKYAMSEIERRAFIEDIEIIENLSGYITEIHKTYLNTLHIGAGSMSLQDSLKLLNEPSRIILENSTNDWKFIRELIIKYKSKKQYKTIYKILNEYLEENWIQPDRAGGAGGIQSKIEDWLDINPNLLCKLMTIFDSDKKGIDFEPKSHKNLIAFLKGKVDSYDYDPKDYFHWHMLHKREMENYIPVKVLSEIYEDVNGLDDYSAEDYDFLDIQDLLKNVENNPKNVFPNYFKRCSRKDLEERCAHHKVNIKKPNKKSGEVSEIELILLKIAKII